MTGGDRFHAGIAVDDHDAALANLAELFGYEGCEPIVHRCGVSDH